MVEVRLSGGLSVGFPTPSIHYLHPLEQKSFVSHFRSLRRMEDIPLAPVSFLIHRWRIGRGQVPMDPPPSSIPCTAHLAMLYFFPFQAFNLQEALTAIKADKPKFIRKLQRGQKRMSLEMNPSLLPPCRMFISPPQENAFFLFRFHFFLFIIHSTYWRKKRLSFR